MGAADCGEYRQAARAIAEAVIRSVAASRSLAAMQAATHWGSSLKTSISAALDAIAMKDGQPFGIGLIFDIWRAIRTAPGASVPPF
jgi:hypothetical protein